MRKRLRSFTYMLQRLLHCTQAASTGDTSKKTAAAASEKGQQPVGTSKDGGSYKPPHPV